MYNTLSLITTYKHDPLSFNLLIEALFICCASGFLALRRHPTSMGGVAYMLRKRFSCVKRTSDLDGRCHLYAAQAVFLR